MWLPGCRLSFISVCRVTLVDAQLPAGVNSGIQIDQLPGAKMRRKP
jgi:hypothetical protein